MTASPQAVAKCVPAANCLAPATPGAVDSLPVDSVTAHRRMRRLSNSSRGSELIEPGSTYLLAVQGSSQAGQYILAGASVLPMGGFSGQVPFPTNDQLATLVADGQLRYVLLGGRGGGPGGEKNSNITAWVKNTCTVVSDATSGVSDLYDCAP